MHHPSAPVLTLLLALLAIISISAALPSGKTHLVHIVGDDRDTDEGFGEVDRP
jgi:hypothetical protein